MLAIVLIVVGYMSAWTALMVDGFFVGQASASSAAGEQVAQIDGQRPERRQVGEPFGGPNPNADSGGLPMQSNHQESGPAGRQLADYLLSPSDHLQVLARGLHSFGRLFSGLLETERRYEPQSDAIVYSTRCRKLTWDYVTESSE